MSDKILEVRHLSKSFGANPVLRDIDFSVSVGDVTCIIGASGSGKSTLLRCINLLETPTTGQILFHGADIVKNKMSIPAYRAKVGMVFQSFNLFNNMTALKNCTIGLRKVLKTDEKTALERSLFFMNKVGMSPYINAKPRQLSGGQKQRVAIARALANRPRIILADEPTAALDSGRAGIVMDLLRKVAAEQDAAILAVTHDEKIYDRFDHIFHLRDGELEQETQQEEKT